MKELVNYRFAVQLMVNKFIEIYYEGEADVHYVGTHTHGIGVINIDDDYWNLDNIEEALYYEIPRDKLFEWYYDEYMGDKEVTVNLVNYFKGVRMPDKKEIKRAEKSMKKAGKVFYKAITK